MDRVVLMVPTIKFCSSIEVGVLFGMSVKEVAREELRGCTFDHNDHFYSASISKNRVGLHKFSSMDC